MPSTTTEPVQSQLAQMCKPMVLQAFDALLLMKVGGRIIYHGPLGPRSENLVRYFEVGVPSPSPCRPGHRQLQTLPSPQQPSRSDT